MKGLQLARENIPDLILSDLMMPNLSGKELLEKVRSDPATSHIPFIMLTANQLEEEKLQSLTLGVDDFMTKPFSLAEIRLKVKNLLELQDRWKERFQQEGILLPLTGDLNEVEKSFRQALNTVMEEELDNAAFSAEDFAKAMHMSRMQLHRKLKALTGQSTSQFIRQYRLHIAALRLKKAEGNISDIAYSVGFSNPNYFSKCFKEMYGVSPSDYSTTSTAS